MPIVGPLVGGLLGAAADVWLIERFLPGVDEPQEVGEIPGPPPDLPRDGGNT